MRTAGIDAAVHTGMALVGDGEDRGRTVQAPPDQRGFQRLQLIASNVADTLQVWQPTFVAIEGYGYNVRNVRAAQITVEVGTAIRLMLYRIGVSWVDVPPTVLKKWTTGRGNATKDDMAVAANERWGYKSPSHDIVDAFCLAQMAQLGWAGVLGINGVTVGCANF